MALSKVRFAENGTIKEEMSYTFYWSEKSFTDRSESDVAFVVRNGLLPSMSEDLNPVSDRIMTRFPLVNSKYCTLITVYTPTMTNSQEKKKQFF